MRNTIKKLDIYFIYSEIPLHVTVVHVHDYVTCTTGKKLKFYFIFFN